MHRVEKKSKRTSVGIARLTGKRLTVSNIHSVKNLQMLDQTVDMKRIAARYEHIKIVPVKVM